MKYVGLTDDPERRCQEHGNPEDWLVLREFGTETDARGWEQHMVLLSEYEGNPGGAGWKYGYVYTITGSTIQ
jgi:hypothetical protein